MVGPGFSVHFRPNTHVAAFSRSMMSNATTQNASAVPALAAITSGIALGSWISTFIVPIAFALLVWRTIVEDRMLRRELRLCRLCGPRPVPAGARHS